MDRRPGVPTLLAVVVSAMVFAAIWLVPLERPRSVVDCQDVPAADTARLARKAEA